MANPLFGKGNGAGYLQSRTDSRIGNGVRVAGNITFTGVLRIQGEILGDVSCDTDLNGTIVVGQTGNVTGTIRAPHIVVSGRVSGPAQSSESIEIQPGACLIGDTSYKAIEVHAGGVIEGTLIPMVSMEGERLNREEAVQTSDSPLATQHDRPLANAVPAGSGSSGRYWNGRTLGGAMVLLIAVVTLVLVTREPMPVMPPASDVELKPSSSMHQASSAKSQPVASSGLQDGSSGLTGDGVPLEAGSDAASKGDVQATLSALPDMDPEAIVTVQGVNPGKPAGIFSVISKEPSVLFKKKSQDPGDGTRIDISKGATISIAIAKNQIFRVTQGRDMIIFYQGRKVAPKIIESGAWMSFVPQATLGASDKK